VIKGYIETRQVYIDDIELLPYESQAIYNHSPDGFAWGYGGSGPAQLALAILLKFCSEDEAKQFYQAFKWVIIATLPKSDFQLSIAKVEFWIAEYKKALTQQNG